MENHQNVPYRSYRSNGYWITKSRIRPDFTIRGGNVLFLKHSRVFVASPGEITSSLRGRTKPRVRSTPSTNGDHEGAVPALVPALVSSATAWKRRRRPYPPLAGGAGAGAGALSPLRSPEETLARVGSASEAPRLRQQKPYLLRFRRAPPRIRRFRRRKLGCVGRRLVAALRVGLCLPLRPPTLPSVA